MNRIEKLVEFLAQSPNDSFLKHALALEHIKANNDNKARKLFEEILAFDENYVGTYYHLAKLLERAGENNEAILIYQKGMQIAKIAKDNHSYNELAAALDNLVDE